jgi:hypothetical protein
MLLSLVDGPLVRSIASEKTKNDSAESLLKVLIRTDREKYSVKDVVKLCIWFEADGWIFIDGRMLLGGPVYGLTLEVNDEWGKPVRFGTFADARLPPPPPRDGVLVALDEDSFYGTRIKLNVKQIFQKPGKYSIRVIYKGWVERGKDPPPLEDLLPIWEAPSVPSEPVWIKITR